jgi:hypothetical protein
MQLNIGRTALAILVMGAVSASGINAQQAGLPQYRNVVSANPFGLLIELFNAEYERVVTESSTVGIGGSTITSDDQRYVNADVFWRFYASDTPVEGWAFGAKVGLTRVPDHGTYFGYGFDANRSWLMGRNNNFYVGIGFGLKRLVGVEDDADGDTPWRYIPTFRLVNIGIAF